MSEERVGRVLVVEDNDETRFMYRAALEMAGWQVDETDNGTQGVDLARRSPPDVAVVDVSLPGIDGWETTRRLKEDDTERGGELKVLAVTAHGLDEDRATAREAGCDGYLVKPIRPDRLVAEVLRLREGAASPESSLAPTEPTDT